MLVIRMQRTGRKGHAQFRVVVQDSRRTPTSGKVVASLGNFDPHTKNANLDKEKASFYLEHGAQPSQRAARLLKSEGVKLPKWVSIDDKKQKSTKNAEKLRKNQPAEPKAPADETAAKPESVEKPADEDASAEAASEPVAAKEVAEGNSNETDAPKTKPEAKEESTEEKTEKA